MNRAAPKGRPSLFLLMTVLECALLAIAVGWGLVRGIKWWHSVVWGPPVLTGAACGALLFIIDMVAVRILMPVRILHLRWIVDELMRPVARGFTLAQIVVLAMLSGIAEECFFRGILLQEIGPLWSSLIFGLLHTGHRNLASLGAWSALVGMLLCLLYVHTGNLAAPIAMHCLNNLLAFIFLKYSD